MVRSPDASRAGTVVLVCCLLLGLSLAGCLGVGDATERGGTQTGVDTPNQTATPTDIHTADRTASPTETPTAPSDTDAEERALAAEEEYITDRLENAACVNSWGLTDYGGIPENATVSERSEDGVTVEVTHPYWYGTDSKEVDAGTRAEYLVTEESVQRVDGDELEPC